MMKAPAFGLFASFALLSGCVEPPGPTGHEGGESAAHEFPDAPGEAAEWEPTAPELVLAEPHFNVTERGEVSHLSVRLDRRPSAPVVIPIRSIDESEVEPSVDEILIEPGAWDVYHGVDLIGLDDPDIDGHREVEIAVGPTLSDDPVFSGLEASTSLRNLDDDIAGALLISMDEAETDESGGSFDVSVHLTARPQAEVTFELAVSDELEALVTPNKVTFDRTNWNERQILTVQGLDDDVQDGDRLYQIEALAPITADPWFVDAIVDPIEAINRDDDLD